MLVTRQWNDESELFEIVSAVLYSDSDLDVRASDEHSEYDTRGTITILHKGRRFRLELQEIV